MIASISHIIVRFVGPLLYLTSIFLSIFSFVGPVPILNTSVSLIEISPGNTSRSWAYDYVRRDEIQSDLLGGRRVPRSNVLRALAAQVLAGKVFDGATIRLGPLGSCGQQNNAAAPLCTNATFMPHYNYQFMPPKAPTDALPRGPPSGTPGLFVASIVFSFIFFLLSFIASLAEILPAVPGFISKFANHGLAARAVAWLGLLGFIIGLMCTIIWRISFGRDVQEFNNRNFDAGADAVQLLARLGTGMTMQWVAHSFAAPSLVAALTKLHGHHITGKAV